MAIRFLHTADWQIGQKASHVASAAATVRRARLDAARAVIEAANRERVHAVILAGDQFEDNLVEDRLVHAIVEILAGSQAPVYVLPGNHDALAHDSIYLRASWKSSPSHIHLLKGHDPIEVPGTDAWLLPAPLAQKKSSEDPTERLRLPEQEGGIRVGIAHGSLRIEGKYSEDDFPIALDAHRRRGLDYLALGHWHGHFTPDGKVVYSGTPETCNFGERNSGQALLVDIPGSGAQVELRQVKTSRLRWATEELDFDLGGETALAALKTRLAHLQKEGESLSNLLLRVRTRGHSGPDATLWLQAFEDEWQEKLLYLQVERADLCSAKMEGQLAELAARYPLVESLVQGIAARGLNSEESGAAMQLLFEVLSAEAG
jgi:DNA repair exonuclease SbcCD nuclease subunit